MSCFLDMYRWRLIQEGAASFACFHFFQLCQFEYLFLTHTDIGLTLPSERELKGISPEGKRLVGEAWALRTTFRSLSTKGTMMNIDHKPQPKPGLGQTSTRWRLSTTAFATGHTAPAKPPSKPTSPGRGPSNLALHRALPNANRVFGNGLNNVRWLCTVSLFFL